MGWVAPTGYAELYPVKTGQPSAPLAVRTLNVTKTHFKKERDFMFIFH